jgi:hypothetical protein
MHYRLTKQGRSVRNTVLKTVLWTICASIVVRGCIGALSDAGRQSTDQPSEAVAQSATTNVPAASYPFADAPLGSTVTGQMRNTSGGPQAFYIDGVRTVVPNGGTIILSGIVMYNKRHKCKAIRVDGEMWGIRKILYVPLTPPMPASFWDCTPDE